MRSTPCSARYAPAGLSALIEPAGLMWSVVTESPSLASTRAPEMSVTGLRRRAHALEVRGLAHVGRLRVPREGRALRRRQALPALVAGEDVGVVLGEHRALDRGVDRVLDLERRRPDVPEEHLLAGLGGAERLVLEVEVHRPGERVRDDQRRRREVVHLHVGVDAALEVPVAGEHRHDRQVVLVDGRRDLVRQRAGVADAGRAAVADEVEAELLQVRPEAGLLVVVGDDLGAGRHRRLDPRLGGRGPSRRPSSPAARRRA